MNLVGLNESFRHPTSTTNFPLCNHIEIYLMTSEINALFRKAYLLVTLKAGKIFTNPTLSVHNVKRNRIQNLTTSFFLVL